MIVTLPGTLYPSLTGTVACSVRLAAWSALVVTCVAYTVEALIVLGALSAAHLGSTDRAGRWASEQGADLLDQHLDLIGFIQHEVAVCAQLGFLLP